VIDADGASPGGSDGSALDTSDGAATDPDATSFEDGEGAGEGGLPALPVVHEPDPDRAAAGVAFLLEGGFGPGLAPTLALRHLWIVWPGPILSKFTYFQSADAYWPDFRARYGFDDSITGSGELPTGLREGVSGQVAIDCLACHAGRIPGGPVALGVPSGRVDVEGLYDDLRALPAAVQALQGEPLPEPFKSLLASVQLPAEIPEIPQVDDTTGAAGALDGFGMGVALGLDLQGAPAHLHRKYGYQDPPAWWHQRHKERMYTDGSVDVGAHRTMMATLLASGMSWESIVALDATFEDVGHALLSLPAPRWEDYLADPIDDELAAQGRALFQTECADCHGRYEGPDAHFPNVVVPASEVGTDPVRAEHFGPAEAEAINALMVDPAFPATATGGYLAPPLTSLWASAPYLHNGSVPDLASLLSPETERPDRWQRKGITLEDFDTERVGWRYDAPPPPQDPTTVEGRKTYDTTRPGLSNQGHTYGTTLPAADRKALLEYLKTL
jgi:mono/diheme cytochrome c family protein